MDGQHCLCVMKPKATTHKYINNKNAFKCCVDPQVSLLSVYIIACSQLWTQLFVFYHGWHIGVYNSKFTRSVVICEGMTTGKWSIEQKSNGIAVLIGYTFTFILSRPLYSKYNRVNDVCVWDPTPRTADVTVTKIAGYVRARILMNRWFFFRILAFIIFTLMLNIWICMQWTDTPWRWVVWGGLDFAYLLARAARNPLLMTTGTRVWTLNPSYTN